MCHASAPRNATSEPLPERRLPGPVTTMPPREHRRARLCLSPGGALAIGRVVAEDEQVVTITLRQPRWQGARAAVYSLSRIPATLSRPLADRGVVDGATGIERTQG